MTIGEKIRYFKILHDFTQDSLCSLLAWVSALYRNINPMNVSQNQNNY